jgi:hypothetical protein
MAAEKKVDNNANTIKRLIVAGAVGSTANKHHFFSLCGKGIFKGST